MYLYNIVCFISVLLQLLYIQNCLIMKKKLLKESTQNYLSNATVHGISFFVAPKLHILERLFWFIILLCAVAGTTAMIMYSYQRFHANPTVVSIKKDFRNWNNPFPAVTGCFLDRVDEVAAYDFVVEKWGLNNSHPKFDYYMDFVKAVANVSYNNIFDLEPYENDVELNKLDMMDIAVAVHTQLTGKLITFENEQDDQWTLVMTELGICFTINSKFSALLGVNHETRENIVNIARNFSAKMLRCHYLNGLCYAKYDSDPLAPIKFFVHSHLDVVDSISYLPLFVFENRELEINYRMQETASDPSLRNLSPNQRRCRFYDEPLDEIPFYSTTLCYIGCRNQLIMKICGCRPFFYHYLDGKLCNITGLLCIAYQAEFLIKSPLEVGCDCPQPCEIITYLPEIPKYTVWQSGYFDQRLTFRWGLLAPTTKYHRNILFTFEDLVVSFGGISALCLGVSFLSVVEFTLYFLECLIICCKRSEKQVGPLSNEKKNTQIGRKRFFNFWKRKEIIFVK